MPRKTDSNSPADWLFIAESDLEGVCLLIEQEVSHPLCITKLAEILEKVLKAELIRTGWFLEKTHDLLKLGGELQARDPDLAKRVRLLCESLAEKYFIDRYPGFDLDDPDWPEMRSQADQIAELLATVKRRVGGDDQDADRNA